jgi:hypothetical protein
MLLCLMMTASSFIAVWCLNPRFIPDEEIIFIPKPNVHVPGNALYVQADEIVHNKFPGLCYLVRLHVVKYQDWSTPSLSSNDEGRDVVDDDDGDSDNSNFSGYHPSLDDCNRRLRHLGYRSVRLTEDGDAAQSLGGRHELTFQPHLSVRISSFAYPIVDGGRVLVGSGSARATPRAVMAVEAQKALLLTGSTCMSLVHSEDDLLAAMLGRGDLLASDINDDVFLIGRRATDTEPLGFISFAMGVDLSLLEGASRTCQLDYAVVPDPAPLPAYCEVEGPVRDISPDRPGLDLCASWDNWQPAQPTSPPACCPSSAPVATVVTATPPPAPTMPVTIMLVTAPASCSAVSVMAPVVGRP